MTLTGNPGTLHPFRGNPAPKPGLMTWVMLLSIGLHLLMLRQMPEVFSAKPLTFIEFETHEAVQARAIPRPRIKSRAAYQAPAIPTPEPPTPVLAPVMPDLSVPQLSPVPEALAALPTPLLGIQSIAPPAMVAPSIDGGLPPGNAIGNSRFLSKKDYFDMLRLKIEAHKKYPARARLKSIEGRVGLYFKINRDGGITDLKVIRPARHNSLNRAALDAVKNCAPFSMLPPHLFAAPVEIEITILFELT